MQKKLSQTLQKSHSRYAYVDYDLVLFHIREVEIINHYEFYIFVSF